MPSRSRPKVNSLALAALVLVIVGLFATGLGVWDAVSARDSQYRFLGGIFGLAGITMVAAATCLFHPRWRGSYGREAAILAGPAGVVVGSCLLVLQLTVPEIGTGRRLGWAAIGWAVITFASAGAAWLVWRTTCARADLPHDAVRADAPLGAIADSATDPVKSRGVRFLAKGLVSLGVSASLLWGAVQFWYTNQYVPGTVGTALSLTTELKELKDQRPSVAETGDRFFTGTIAVKNVSTTKVQVLSSIYSVTRVPQAQTRLFFQDETKLADDFFERFIPSRDNPALRNRRLAPQCDGVPPNDDRPVSRYSELYLESARNMRVLELGKAVDDHTYFEPGEEYTRHFLVHVPNDLSFQSSELNLSVQLWMAKGKRLVLGEKESHGPEHVRSAVESDFERCHHDFPVPGRYVVTEWPVRRLSLIRELTAGRHAVNTILVLTKRRRMSENGTKVLLEEPFLALCVDRAERFKQASERNPIRNDPDRVCPGIVDPNRAPKYYGGIEESYGVTGTSATNEVPLPSSG